MFSARTLQRLHDSEVKVAEDEDVYTLAEHLRLIVAGVFTEWSAKPAAAEYTDRKPYIDSFRRNLQRETLQQLANLVTGESDPKDARTLARMHLQKLNTQIANLLKAKDLKLDDYSRAHLLDCQSQIKRVLDAQLSISSGGGGQRILLFGAEPQ